LLQITRLVREWDSLPRQYILFMAQDRLERILPNIIVSHDRFIELRMKDGSRDTFENDRYLQHILNVEPKKEALVYESSQGPLQEISYARMAQYMNEYYEMFT